MWQIRKTAHGEELWSPAVLMMKRFGCHQAPQPVNYSVLIFAFMAIAAEIEG